LNRQFNKGKKERKNEARNAPSLVHYIHTHTHTHTHTLREAIKRTAEAEH
jgi:hypothetical protein